MKNLIESWSAKERLSLALVLSGLAVYIATHGAIVTKADVMFADLFHNSADLFFILLLWLSLFIRGRYLQIISKLSGLALLAAGGAATIKAFDTIFEGLKTGKWPPLEAGFTLLWISLAIIVILFVLMLLIGKEHEELHEGSQHHKNIHTAARTELIADIIQASAGIVEFFILLALPHHPEFVRGVDILLTVLIGFWMMWRGNMVIKEHSH